MKTIKKNTGKVIMIFILITSAIAIQSCYAQKHHKSVPCPCEKRR